MDISNIGRMLLLLGIGLAVMGGIIMLVGRVPFLGQLPGDVTFQRGPVTFFFPIATGIILSIVLTIVLNVAIRLFSR